MTEGLKYAIEENKEDLTKAILSRGPNLDKPLDECGVCGPLIFALRLDHLSIARELVLAGCGVHEITCPLHKESGIDAAHYAVKSGDNSLLEVLLSRGYRGSSSTVHPIFVAIALKLFKAVQILLQHTLKGDDSFNGVDERQVEFRYLPEKNNTWPWHIVGVRAKDCPQVSFTALHYAVWCDDKLMVDLLLSSGALVNATTSKGETVLHLAGSCGHLHMVDVLLKEGADINIALHVVNYTPLFSATLARKVDVVRRLCDPMLGVDINARDNLGNGCLHVAVIQGDEECVNVLLEEGADQTTCNFKYQTPLMIAIINKNPNIVKKLLCSARWESALNMADSQGLTALHLAAETGHLSIVTMLLDHGADQTLQTSDLLQRKTPFFSAITSKRATIAQKLLNAISIDIRNSKNWSTLHACVEHLDAESTAKLLEFGIDVNITENDGITPLHWAVLSPEKLPIVLELLNKGANIHARDVYGRTPFQHAARCNKPSIDICKALFEYGARPGDADLHEFNSLHEAIVGQSLETIQFIHEIDRSLISKANIYQCPPLHFIMESESSAVRQWGVSLCKDVEFYCNDFCGSLLHEACKWGRIDNIRDIIKRCTLSEFQQLCNKYNQNLPPLLILTVRRGDIDSTKVLLDAGAEINIAKPPWASPLFIACSWGRVEVAKLLLTYCPGAWCKDGNGEDVTMEAAAGGNKIVLKWLKERDQENLSSSSKEVPGTVLEEPVNNGDLETNKTSDEINPMSNNVSEIEFKQPANIDSQS